MWKTNSAECFSGMHHIRLRCGWRAFFFKYLAHGLVGERVDVGQFDHAPGQKPQCPAGASFGRSRAGQRDQVRLLGTVELVLIDAFSTPVGAQGGGEPLLDKAPAHALDGRDPDLERLGNALIRPARSAFGLIGFKQDLSVLDLANIGLAPREQPPQFIALVSRERHPIPLGHDRPPGSASLLTRERSDHHLTADAALVLSIAAAATLLAAAPALAQYGGGYGGGGYGGGGHGSPFAG